MSLDGPFRLHIKNNRAGEEIFRTTADRLAEALERNDDIASAVEVSVDWDTDRFDELMADAHGLVTWDLPTERLSEVAPELRWIHIIGAGVEHLAPLDWLPEGVMLTNNAGVHAQKAGEYGLMAVLMLANRMPELAAAQRRHDYVEQFTTTVNGSTLLVVGAGQLGGAVARAVRPHGVRTVGLRRTVEPSDSFDEVRSIDELDDLLPVADWVLVTTPLTDATRGLIDARRLALMRPGAGLINMGRGPVVDVGALRGALESGHLRGALVDVFDPEPVPSESPLWDTPNLVMTPHMSSDDAVTYVPRTLDLVFENVRRTLAGRDLLNVVDPTRGY